MNKTLLRSGVAAMLIKLVAAALSYIMFVVLARWLGPDNYGRYAAAFSAGTFISFMMLAGLHTDVLRRLSAFETGLEDPLRRAYFLGFFRSLGLSFTGFTFLAFIAAIGAWGFGKPEWSTMIILSIAFGAAIALAEFMASVFRVFGAVNIALVPRDVVWRGLVVLSVSCLISMGVTTNVGFAAAISILLLLTALVGQAFVGRHLLPPRSSISPVVPSAPAMLWKARWLAIATISSNLLQPLAIVGVGAVLSYSDSGVFFSAQKTAALLLLPLIAMNMIGAPQIARAWINGNKAEVQNTCRHIVITASCGALVGFVILVFFAKPLLGIFDPSYRDYSDVLIILAGSSLVNTIAGPTAALMQMTGREKSLVWLVAVGQGIGLLLVVLGGAFWELSGAAWGHIAGTTLWNGAIVLWSRHNLKIDPSIFALK